MTDPIQIDLNRPQRYWYVDGLAEMAGGAGDEHGLRRAHAPAPSRLAAW